MPAFPHSNVLLISADAVHSLLPPTLISQIGALLELHKIDPAVALAEQHRKRLNRDPNAIDHVEVRPNVKPRTLHPYSYVSQAQELRFVYQRIGFACLQDTLFEDAGKHLFAGDLDPRILISYFPDLRGSLFKPGDAVEVFAGIARYLLTAQSVEEISEWSSFTKLSPPLRFNTFISFSPSTCSTSKPTACTTILHLASRPPHSPVLLVPWLALGLMSSCGKHSQELLSVHDSRHQYRSSDRRTQKDPSIRRFQYAGEFLDPVSGETPIWFLPTTPES